MEFLMEKIWARNADKEQTRGRELKEPPQRGLLDWVLRWWRSRQVVHPHRLSVIERISLGQKQGLVLVDVEGVHLLVSIAGDGAPTVYPLDSATEMSGKRRGGAWRRAQSGNSLALIRSRVSVARAAGRAGRASW
jgi:hypothetical protein